MVDFIRNPDLGPKSRIRRTVRSDALKSNNALDLKNKSKVNEVLHDVIDNNNNNSPHMSKDERKLIYMKKHPAKQNETSPSTPLANGVHSKTE